MTLNLLELADAELTRKKLHKPKMANWPTDSAIELTDLLGQKSVVGKCMRYLWYKWKGIGESNPAGAKAQRIFAMGNAIEAGEIEIHKKIGIWFDNNIKFFDKELNLSGEIDEIVYENPAERGKENPELVIVEFKSTHGYFAEKQILGDRKTAGSPKLDHIMQIGLYLYCNKDIPYGKIIYIFRDKARRREFNIKLKYDKEKRCHQILVDGRRTINIDEPFLPETITMDIEDILERFSKVEEVITKDKPPERDFSLQYSRDELKFLYEKDRLSKAHKRIFEGGGLPRKGDWRCGYCSFKDICWDTMFDTEKIGTMEEGDEEGIIE